MKQHYYTPLFFGLLALAFLSCEKEAVTVGEPAADFSLSPEQRYERMIKPLVLYQFSFINLETREENGWIIDYSGLLKSYRRILDSTYEPTSENEILTPEQMIDLYAIAGENAGNVSIDELLNRFHQSLSVSRRFLSGTTIHQDNKHLTAFYAYTLKNSSGGHSNKNNRCNYPVVHLGQNIHTEAQVNRLIVNLSGYFDRYETSNTAIDLHNWLKSVNEAL